MITFRVDRLWNYIAQHVVVNALLKSLGQVVLANLVEFVYYSFAIFRNVVEPLADGKLRIRFLKVSVSKDKKSPLKGAFTN